MVTSMKCYAPSCLPNIAWGGLRFQLQKNNINRFLGLSLAFWSTTGAKSTRARGQKEGMVVVNLVRRKEQAQILVGGLGNEVDGQLAGEENFWPCWTCTLWKHGPLSFVKNIFST